MPDFGPWSVKDGVPHAHAPASLLERMVTRPDLDACDETNGALRVIPVRIGTANSRRPTLRVAKRAVRRITALLSRAMRCLRPLLLHASSPATAPRHRRVIHLEFAVDELPGGPAWERISA